MVYLVASQQQFSCLSAVMNHVAVVLDDFFVSLLGDSVDPRLLNFHLRLVKMNVEVFAHAI